MKCPSCGAENPDHARFCNLCLSTVGFECDEYTAASPRDEGFSNKYPSSFDKDAPVPDPDTINQQPDAPPVDVGRYGVRSGERVPEAGQDDQGSAAPVDVGQYGARSGSVPHQPAPLPQDYEGGSGGKKRRKRRR